MCRTGVKRKDEALAHLTCSGLCVRRRPGRRRRTAVTAVSRPANLRALASIGRFVAVLSRTAGVDGRMFSLCPAALKHTRFATIASRGEEECRYSGNRFERYREVAIDAETAGRTALPGMAFLYPTPLTCPPCKIRPSMFPARMLRTNPSISALSGRALEVLFDRHGQIRLRGLRQPRAKPFLWHGLRE